LAALFTAAGVARANTTFGTGYYTNLCGSGTAATSYSCDPGCDLSSGFCSSNNGGVVRWVCSGKWDQCIEAESQWGNNQDVTGVNCNKTVQISLFDKKCRREDGSWDTSCQLKGYMVWYSGECSANFTPMPTKQVNANEPISSTPTRTPALSPTASAAIQPTNTPTPTIQATRTPTPTPNPNPSITPAAVATTPNTGGWGGWKPLMLAALGAAGWQLRKTSNQIWKIN
jgi:cell division septation protein DedD